MLCYEASTTVDESQRGAAISCDGSADGLPCVTTPGSYPRAALPRAASPNASPRVV